MHKNQHNETKAWDKLIKIVVIFFLLLHSSSSTLKLSLSHM